MKWQGRRKSTNVDDRRGRSGGGGGISPMLLIPLIRLLFSKAGIFIVGGIILFLWLTGTSPIALLEQFTGGGPSAQHTEYKATPAEQELADFTAVVLADTEDVWNELIQNYREPTLVLFSGRVSSACGSASSATGPFYCPADENVYIDLSFFRDMETKLGASGDFAQAYVVAHEVGHHIQKLMGTTEKVQSQRGRISQAEYNQLSVRLELQADFLAGVWAHHTHRINNHLEEGDIDEALAAANAIGDDRLQKQATGTVVPDSFTHGTSAQRMRWFKKGFTTGDLQQGDTFSVREL